MAALPLWSSLVDRFPFVFPSRFRGVVPLVPVVRLAGVIGAAMPLRPGLSIASCAGGLERAFGMKGAKAVALVINSPGGSAVQSHLIFKRIRQLAEEKKLPVLAFVEDAAASGGYMLACAGDEIIADPSSIVGSIGVISAGFGFEGLLERIGVERRVHSAGEMKAMLDPFRPEQAQDVERLKAIQARVQEMFVGLVKNRRPDLVEDDAALFTGAVWAGSEAVELGLVDAVGDLRSVLRQRYGDKVRMKLVPTGGPGLFGRWFRRRPLTEGTIADPAAIVAAVEERAAWARLGL